MTLSGTGCLGPSPGAALYLYQPDGSMYTGDGGSAHPDGSWDLNDDYPTWNSGLPTGTYKAVVKCIDGHGSQYFTYPPQYFTVTQ